MKTSKPVAQRLARYMAGIVLITGTGVIVLVGLIEEIPFNKLWISLLWGGVGSLLLGWAVGHAAGRLVVEVQTPEESNKNKLTVKDKKEN